MIQNSEWLEAKEAIANSSSSSSVYIGADSIRFRGKNGKWNARYCVVVVLHNDSKKGCKLFHAEYTEPDYGGMKQRLLNEVNYAITAATEIVDVIGDRYFEIHLDLNPNPAHKSSVAVKEALGWVKGSLGLDAVIKPMSFAATHCADHLVKLKL